MFFCSFERTDIIQITKITFYYNRFSVAGSNEAMGRFGVQLLLEDNTSSTRYNISKNDRFSDSSTEWTKIGLNFTGKKHGNKLINENE